MFLDQILNSKRSEIEIRKEKQPLRLLQKKLEQAPAVRGFKTSITGDTIRLIAEIKKASPSKGLLCPNFDPAYLGKAYETAGAAAISVLTDEQFFQGSLDYLRLVKEVTLQTPVLRKDFIIDPYQLVEARVYGADAVLLIATALSKSDLQQLIAEATALGLSPLVEVHNRTELENALNSGADIIGINNRDLQTFQVNLETTYNLVKLIPPEILVVSESGIKDRAVIQRLAAAGVDTVLVGESIVTAADPKRQIRQLLGMVS